MLKKSSNFAANFQIDSAYETYLGGILTPRPAKALEQG